MRHCNFKFYGFFSFDQFFGEIQILFKHLDSDPGIWYFLSILLLWFISLHRYSFPKKYYADDPLENFWQIDYEHNENKEEEKWMIQTLTRLNEKWFRISWNISEFWWLKEHRKINNLNSNKTGLRCLSSIKVPVGKIEFVWSHRNGKLYRISWNIGEFDF